MMSRHPFIRYAALVAATAGCTSLADVSVTYEECVPVRGTRYADEFTSSFQDMLDRCWQSDPIPDGAKTFTKDGDLVMRPIRGARWTTTTVSPIVYRRMTGDFLVATRVEALATLLPQPHCLDHDEAAGLVVRRTQPFAWATLFVRPFFDGGTPLKEACKDESAHPPSARVLANSLGLPDMKPNVIDNAGLDGEADVAMCRQADQLAYYYKSTMPQPNQPAWVKLGQQVIGMGPLDVGLTVSAAPVGTEDSGMEAHFAWAVFEDYANVPPVDGCQGALAMLVTPEGP